MFPNESSLGYFYYEGKKMTYPEKEIYASILNGKKLIWALTPLTYMANWAQVQK